MKKIFTICVSAVMALTLSACGDLLDNGVGVIDDIVNDFTDSVNNGIQVVEDTGEKIEDTLTNLGSDDENIGDSDEDKDGESEGNQSSESDNNDSADGESTEVDSKDDKSANEESETDLKTDEEKYDSYIASYTQMVEENYKKYPEFNDDSCQYPFKDYLLYDIDKDGTPELIMRCGQPGNYKNEYEDDYLGSIFTMRDNSIFLIAENLNISNKSFYTDPDENGVLLYYSGIDNARLERLSIDGDGVKTETLHEETLDTQGGTLSYRKNADAADTEEFVEGSLGLSFFMKSNSLAVRKFDEIMEHIDGKRMKNPNATFPEGDEKFYNNVLSENQEIIVVPSDTFMRNAGKINIHDMYNDGVLYDYTNGKLHLEEMKYKDLNEDNILEAVLYLAGEDEEKKNEYLCRVVLSVQDDTVYAYTHFYPSEAEITKYGEFAISGSYGTYYERMVYDKEEVQRYVVPVH